MPGALRFLGRVALVPSALPTELPRAPLGALSYFLSSLRLSVHMASETTPPRPDVLSVLLVRVPDHMSCEAIILGAGESGWRFGWWLRPIPSGGGFPSVHSVFAAPPLAGQSFDLIGRGERLGLVQWLAFPSHLAPRRHGFRILQQPLLLP